MKTYQPFDVIRTQLEKQYENARRILQQMEESKQRLVVSQNLLEKN